MGHPELNSDESILLATQNVVVKSVPFEAILTNERLILVNSRDTLMPPQDIPLASVSDLDPGENAIRDPTITISIRTESGATRQMILTFSRQVGSERKRECDEWVKILRSKIDSYKERRMHAVAPAFEPEETLPDLPAAPPKTITAGVSPAKKKIEIARPLKKITETVQTPQKPVETSSLPQGSFCSRCGSRVSPDSLFCNRCGTPVVAPSKQRGTEPEPREEPAVPQVSVPVPPVVTPIGLRRGRPIEDVIHSIEPLIEDSKPRTQPSPLVPSRHITHSIPSTVAEKIPEQPAVAPADTAEMDPVQKNLLMFSNILVSAPEEQNPVVSEAPTGVEAPSTIPDVTPTPPVAEEATPAPASPPPVKISSKKPAFIAAALIVIIIIVVVIGAFVFMKDAPKSPLSTSTQVPTTISTLLPVTTVPTTIPVPVITSVIETPLPTPASMAIPENGVWVRVKYAGTFTGSYGIPGYLHDVTGTGEQLYQIPTNNGVVVTSFAKDDGSGDVILTEVYKDGILIKSESSTTPKGIVQIQIDLRTVAPLP